MPAIAQWYTGERLQNVKLTPLTVAVDGTYTKGTPVSLTASESLESVDFEDSEDTEEISGANAGQRNHVGIKGDHTVTITEIVDRTGQALAMNAWTNTGYFLLESLVSANGTATSMLMQAICKSSSFHIGYAEGKSNAVLVGLSAGLPIVYIPSGGSAIY